MHWSPWRGWLWPPSSKDPPEKPEVLHPSAKCLFRTHRGHTGDMWVSCPGQGRAVKLWQCHVTTKPCFPRPGWQHLLLPLHLPAFPAASPRTWQHRGDPGWYLPLPRSRMPGLDVGLGCSCAAFHPAALAGRLVPTVPPVLPRLSSCSELHPSRDGHLLPATTGAVGQACRGRVRAESPDPVGGGRRGCQSNSHLQRSCRGWPWPTGLRASLGTAVASGGWGHCVPMLVLGPAPSALVFSLWVGSHEPEELVGSTALPAALPAVLAGLTLPQSPSMGPAGTGEWDKATPGNQRSPGSW